jgi:hypothetical protein
MMLRAALLFLTLMVGVWPSLCLAAPKTISVDQYRTLLQTAAKQLKQMETQGPRLPAPVLKALAIPYTVQRADGATQTVLSSTPGLASGNYYRSASRQTVQEAHTAVLTQLSALDAWDRSQYAPADAQAIVAQLEGSGQIRTGPTWVEQSWANFYKAFADAFKRFLNWFGDLFPSGSPGEMPEINPSWIRAVFFISVVALLAAIAYLIWQIIGNRRSNQPQGAFAFSPEDAELLALPPNELRARATRFASEGNYREALRHLYIAMLLNLDEREVWRYDARRTNWEHIAALEKNTTHNLLVTPLADITRRFDRVRYGNADCTQHDWNAFERDVNNLEAKTAS